MDRLDVITTRFNPMGWQAPERHYRDWVEHMLDSGVRVTVCELGYGDEAFRAEHPHVRHIGVRANSWCWSKENLLNIACESLADARYVCWSDADIFHLDNSWADRTVEVLQDLAVVQTWSDCCDLGPANETLKKHLSFGEVLRKGGRLDLATGKFRLRTTDGAWKAGHPGYSWACRREFLDATGGFLDVALMGSGDRQMAHAIMGEASSSIRTDVGTAYARHLLDWQRRAFQASGGRVGVVSGSIEHRFHGYKQDRGYDERWEMFVQHRFDPSTDIVRNRDGVIEWSGRKPALEAAWRKHVRSRNEDGFPGRGRSVA